MSEKNPADEKVPLSFWDLAKIDPESAEKLFPELPEGYFGEDFPGLAEDGKKEPESRPFVNLRNLNDGGDSEDLKPKPAVEIGWKWEF